MFVSEDLVLLRTTKTLSGEWELHTVRDKTVQVFGSFTLIAVYLGI